MNGRRPLVGLRQEQATVVALQWRESIMKTTQVCAQKKGVGSISMEGQVGA